MNDELAEVIAGHSRRFRGVAILPTLDPDAMIAELHRAVTQLGFVGAYVAVGPTAKRVDHPDYERLYEALVELDATFRWGEGHTAGSGNRIPMKGRPMKQISIFVIAAAMAVSVSGAMTLSAGGADDESSPIFFAKSPQDTATGS